MVQHIAYGYPGHKAKPANLHLEQVGCGRCEILQTQLQSLLHALLVLCSMARDWMQSSMLNGEQLKTLSLWNFDYLEPLCHLDPRLQTVCNQVSVAMAHLMSQRKSASKAKCIDDVEETVTQSKCILLEFGPKTLQHISGVYIRNGYSNYRLTMPEKGTSVAQLGRRGDGSWAVWVQNQILAKNNDTADDPLDMLEPWLITDTCGVWIEDNENYMQGLDDDEFPEEALESTSNQNHEGGFLENVDKTLNSSQNEPYSAFSSSRNSGLFGTEEQVDHSQAHSDRRRTIRQSMRQSRFPSDLGTIPEGINEQEGRNSALLKEADSKKRSSSGFGDPTRPCGTVSFASNVVQATRNSVQRDSSFNDPKHAHGSISFVQGSSSGSPRNGPELPGTALDACFLGVSVPQQLSRPSLEALPSFSSEGSQDSADHVGSPRHRARSVAPSFSSEGSHDFQNNLGSPRHRLVSDAPSYPSDGVSSPRHGLGSAAPSFSSAGAGSPRYRIVRPSRSSLSSDFDLNVDSPRHGSAKSISEKEVVYTEQGNFIADLVLEIIDQVVLESQSRLWKAEFAPFVLPDNSALLKASVDPIDFEQPCQNVDVSGGTAPFFRARYKVAAAPEGKGSEGCFIGKDLAHAADEIDFYNELRAATQSPEKSFWLQLAKTCMACPGSVRLECSAADGNSSRELLLLENLFHGFTKVRLCDIKMGETTAVAGWKGKSQFRAIKNQQLDARTNSGVEGYRLEGMDNPPQSLKMRLAAIHDNILQSEKQARRFASQQLRGAEFLEQLLDVSELGVGSGFHAHSAALQLLERVVAIGHVLRSFPVPQQWIGSSLALGLEVGELSCCPRVLVKVFDWGRSELNTPEKHRQLSLSVRKERIKYWRNYNEGFCRITWELARLVWHQCTCPRWCGLAFELRSESVGKEAYSHGSLHGIAHVELPGGEVDAGMQLVFSATHIRRVSSSCSIAPAGRLPIGRAVSEPVLGQDLISDVNPLDKCKSAAEGVELELPILGHCKEDAECCPVLGALHVLLRSSERSYGPLLVEVKDMVGSSTSSFFHSDKAGHKSSSIRVIAFESQYDLRNHVDAWNNGLKEPQPLGRVVVRTLKPGVLRHHAEQMENSSPTRQSRRANSSSSSTGSGSGSMPRISETAEGHYNSAGATSPRENSPSNTPGSKLISTTSTSRISDTSSPRSISNVTSSRRNHQAHHEVWDQTLEFQGVGDEGSMHMESRVANLLEISLDARGNSNMVERNIRNLSKWPSLLPPLLGDHAAYDREAFKLYMNAVAPWIKADAYLMPHW